MLINNGMATEVVFSCNFLKMCYNLLSPSMPIQASQRKSWELNASFHLSYVAQGMSTPQLYPRNLKNVWSEDFISLMSVMLT